jgi:Spy/CpxP family protein refolding chaperone
MKKALLLSLLVVFTLPLAAQHGGRPNGAKHKDITELVSDLSNIQKRKIEAATKDSKARVDNLRKQQRAVLDSINMYMERDGDQSAALFPLFDREAALHAAIDREMYAGKLRIDEILTKEQRAELRKACAKDRPQRKNK